MKVSQYRSVYEEIELTAETVNDITIKRLQMLVSPGEYLREEKGKIVLKQDDPGWRHGSISEEVVREATELDIAVFKVLTALRKKDK
jgi:hypothetical protein